MRILVGVDLAATGHDWLVDQAAALAVRLRAPLDLLYVEVPGTSADDPGHQARLARLSELSAARIPAEVRGAVLAEPGEPAEHLSEAAAGYDAIVVGPREPGPIERVILGPMSVRVLRRAHVPVFVARRALPLTRPLRVLVGLDVSRAGAERMVREAAVWAERLHGTLDAAYVDSETLPSIHNRAVRERARKEWEAARTPHVARLHELVDALDPGVRGAARVAEGNPESTLAELASEYDIVVVGTRERAGVSRFLLGSVAGFVVRKAGCSVLTLPSHTWT